MVEPAQADAAAAYEQYALEYTRRRDQSSVGATVIESWARSLDSNTTILELGCGAGYPVTRVLDALGFDIWAIDASPSLLDTFRTRYPEIPVQCARVQESDFFQRQFGAVICVGLIFLLNEDEQRTLIRRAGQSLLPQGRFLFSAPVQTGCWIDVLTGHQSRSLGQAAYADALHEAGFDAFCSHVDQGENHYYDVRLG